VAGALASALLGATLLGAGRARAAPPPFEGALRVGAPARPVRVRVERDGEGGTRIAIGGRGGPAATLDVGPVDDVGVEQVALAGGAEVAVVRLVAGDTEVGAALVAAPGGRAEILATARTRWRGDPGERRAEAIEVGDRTGDGAPDVIVGTLLEARQVCGAPRTLLFPRAVDPGTQRLRPVTLSPLPPAGPEVGLVASSETPGPSGPPLLPGLRVTGASSADGAGDDAALVDAPRVLERAGEGAWAEGRGGAGRFEFVTARLETGGRAIRAFALTPSPRDAALAARLARPRTLWLVGDGGARLRVTLPEDGLRRPGERYWVTPPAPLAWRCLAVVLDEVYAPPGVPADAVRAGLAGVEVYTDLDFGGGLDRLVRDLVGDGPDASAAGELLARVPDRAVPAIAAAWPRLTAVGRRRAVRAVGAALLRGERPLPDGHAAPNGPRAAALGLLARVAAEDDDAEASVLAVDALAAALPLTTSGARGAFGGARPATGSGGGGAGEAGVGGVEAASGGRDARPPVREDLDALEALVAAAKAAGAAGGAARVSADRAVDRLAHSGDGHVEALLDVLSAEGGTERAAVRAALTDGLRRALADRRTEADARARLAALAGAPSTTPALAAAAALAAAPVPAAAEETRALVATAIARLGEPAAARTEGARDGPDASTDEDFAARWRAIAALATLGEAAASDPGAVRWLATTATDAGAPWMLRAAALEALAALGGGRSTDGLRPLAGGAEGAQASGAGSPLAGASAGASEDAAGGGSEAPSDVRSRVATTARAALADPYPRVRLAAVRALLGASPEGALAAVALGARDPFPLVRAGALAALGDAGPAHAARVTGALLAGIGDAKEAVRAAAIDALARRGERAATDRVRARLADADEWPVVTTAALGYVRATCAFEAAPEVLAVLGRGLRPGAWAPDVDAGVLALDTAVALGGQARRDALQVASRASAPEAVRAAAERLRARPTATCRPAAGVAEAPQILPGASLQGRGELRGRQSPPAR
jgi:hypothetical protein